MPTAPARGMDGGGVPKRARAVVADELGTWSVIASLAVGCAFFALWFWLLPQWLGFSVNLSGARRLRLIACIPSIMGFAIAMRCVWDFGRTGHGTPAPIAPPKYLVVTGFYRYVRNPMYVGFLLGWIFLWIAFGVANRYAISAAAAVIIGVHLFVVEYEEPGLQVRFGEDYERYCANVRRWIPRLSAWDPN